MEENKNFENVVEQGGRKPPPRPMPPRPPFAQTPKPVVQPAFEQRQATVNSTPQQKLEIPQNQQEETQKQTPKIESSFVQEKYEEKITKEKPKKTRHRKEINKKKLAIILGSVVGSIALVVGLVFLVLYLLPVAKLSAPQNIEILQGDTVCFVTCDEVEGAKKYIFDINGMQYDCKTPYMNLDVLTIPDSYKIKVCAMGEDPRSVSPFSQIVNFILKTRLKTPTIHFLEEGSSIVTWASVENAQGYELICQNVVTALSNVNQFDLRTLGGGMHVVQIRAVPPVASNYTLSRDSNILQYECYEKLSGIDGRVLEDNLIEINRVNNAKEYKLTINTEQIIVPQFSEEKTIVDPKTILTTPIDMITYLKIEAVGQNYFLSGYKEIDVV